MFVVKCTEIVDGSSTRFTVVGFQTEEEARAWAELENKTAGPGVWFDVDEELSNG